MLKSLDAFDLFGNIKGQNITLNEVKNFDLNDLELLGITSKGARESLSMRKNEDESQMNICFMAQQ